MMNCAVDNPALGVQFLMEFVPLWQWIKVYRMSFHIGEAAFQSFLAAV
jgi:hypothetical protein